MLVHGGVAGQRANAARRAVVHKVRPGRRRPRKAFTFPVHPLLGDGHPLEGGHHVCIDPRGQLAKRFTGPPVELGHRVPTRLPGVHVDRQRQRVHGITEPPHERDVVAPVAVEHEQRQAPLDRAQLAGPEHGTHRFKAGGTAVLEQVEIGLVVHNTAPHRLDLTPLGLGQRGVLPEPPADVEVLPLDDPLRTVDLAAQNGAVDRLGLLLWQMSRPDQVADAEPLDERVIETDEELRRSGVPLPAGAAA